MSNDIANLRFAVDSTQLKRATGDLKNVSSESGKATGSISGMGRSFLRLAVPIATLGGAVQQMRAITREAEMFERQMLRTNAVVEATGATAGFTADQLREQARALAFATLESTEGVMQAQQVLLTFRSVSGDTFTRATELAADLATVTGGSLTGSMQQLGRALEDPVQGITALRRSGVSFTDSQKELIASLTESGDLLGAQNVILDELAQQYGGVARAEAMGLAGAQDTLGQSVQELRLAIDDFLGSSERLTNWYNAASGVVQEFTAILASGQIQFYIQSVANEFEYLWQDVQAAMGLITDLVGQASQMWGQSGVDAVGFLRDAFGNLVPNIKTAVQLATIELLVLVDRAALYGRAIANSLDPRNWRDGISFADFVEEENRRIDSVRMASINAILQERDAAIEATSERRKVILEQGQLVRQEWEREQRELERLAFVAGDTARMVTEGMESASGSARDFTSDLQSLRTALGTDMENAASMYLTRLELIADAEAEAALSAEEANDLRARSYEAYQDKLTELAEAGSRERQRIMEQEEAQRAQREMAQMTALQGFFGNLAYIAQQGGEESFKAYKALAVVEAGIAGSLAFVKALAAAPPPFNFMLAGSVAAATAVQMAMIQGQSYKQRAMGGQVSAGDSVLVGERGPEVLRMGSSGGHVTPNHQLQGGGVPSVTVVLQISTGVQETVQAEIVGLMPVISEQTQQAVISAISQGGSMSKAVGKRR